MREDLKNRDWSVYVHVTPNLKYYVGLTSRPVDIRWKNGDGYAGQSFYKAIKKYGWDNIIHIVVAEGLNIEQATTMESMLILLLDSIGENGYNCSLGGDTGNYGTVSQATRDKISKALKGKTWTLSEETKKKMSEAKRNMSPEQKAKLKKAKQDYWNAMSEAEKLLVIEKRRKSKEKTLKLRDNKKLADKYKKKLAKKLLDDKDLIDKRYNEYLKKRVYCLTTNEIFESITTASKKYGVDGGNISKACQGKLSGAGKLPDGTQLRWTKSIPDFRKYTKKSI